jgi:peptidyl-prolyl cis-trans isomerase B (cyclophilin B)
VSKQQIEDAEKNIDFGTKEYGVELTTNHGPIRLTFLPDVAPGHVKNFVALAQIGFYNGLTFHRIIDGFMIQGGCPLGTGTGDAAGRKIKAEFNKTPHEDGTLSMARAQDPNSAGSQFFICVARQRSLDNQYTVFGKTADAESLETVHKIGKVRTGANDKPVQPVTIEKATVTEKAK